MQSSGEQIDPWGSGGGGGEKEGRNKTEAIAGCEHICLHVAIRQRQTEAEFMFLICAEAPQHGIFAVITALDLELQSG